MAERNPSHLPAVSITTRMRATPPSTSRRHPHDRGRGRSCILDLPERERLILAAETLVREQGLQALTLQGICERAATSRAAFEDCFTDPEDCLLAVFEKVIEDTRAAMRSAYRAERCWLDGVRSALAALLAMLDQSTPIARLLIVDSALGDTPLRVRREHAIRELALALERERPSGARDTPQAPFGAEALVGAGVSVLHSRLVEDPVPALTELAGPLMGMIVLPYLGAGASREELTRRAPAPT